MWQRLPGQPLLPRDEDKVRGASDETTVADESVVDDDEPEGSFSD